MGIYSKHILPKVINWTCKQNPSMKQRAKVVPLAYGNVLEVGIGSGLNLPFYEAGQLNHLSAIDPSIELWQKNTIDTKSLGFGFDFIQGYAENMPFENNTFDSVILTYTLCTIPDVNQAFVEILRVMKPNGTIIFYEHGKAPDKSVERWQNRANYLWKKIGGGCHLNRNIPCLIKDNG